MNLWSPWLDPAGDSLRGVAPERYALAAGPEGQFLRLAADDTIETVQSLEHAFQFHTDRSMSMNMSRGLAITPARAALLLLLAVE